jgi:hypothetical protein
MYLIDSFGNWSIIDLATVKPPTPLSMMPMLASGLTFSA